MILPSQNKENQKAKVRRENMELILRSGEEVFAAKGFKGATTQEIAEKANIPKANLHYYFRGKCDLYGAVLENIFVEWVKASEAFDSSNEPEQALTAYIGEKLRSAFDRPFRSKVWANEIIHGANFIDGKLKNDLLEWQEEKVAQINMWISEGKIREGIDPKFFLYSIWAITQHYADFNHQIEMLNSGKVLTAAQKQEVFETVSALILHGAGLEPVSNVNLY